MTTEIIEVLRTERHVVLARVDGRRVYVGFVPKDASQSVREDLYLWNKLVKGWVNPTKRGLIRSLFEETERSIPEAVDAVIAEVHRHEFLVREAEAQVDAARSTMKALAEIERELGEGRRPA